VSTIAQLTQHLISRVEDLAETNRIVLQRTVPGIFFLFELLGCIKDIKPRARKLSPG